MDTKLQKSIVFHPQTDGQMEVVMQTKPRSSSRRSNWFIKLYMKQLEKSQAKYKARHDKHRVDHHFQVGDQVWLYISKECLKGEGKKLKPIRYGPFKILEKIGDNAFWLELPPYMQMYSMVNVENLKLYEPPMIMDQGENVQVPSVDDFSPEYLDELQEDVILDRRVRTS
jgi:hypothetical protein